MLKGKMRYSTSASYRTECRQEHKQAIEFLDKATVSDAEFYYPPWDYEQISGLIFSIHNSQNIVVANVGSENIAKLICNTINGV